MVIPMLTDLNWVTVKVIDLVILKVILMLMVIGMVTVMG